MNEEQEKCYVKGFNDGIQWSKENLDTSSNESFTENREDSPKDCNYTSEYGCSFKWEGDCLLINEICPRNPS